VRFWWGSIGVHGIRVRTDSGDSGNRLFLFALRTQAMRTTRRTRTTAASPTTSARMSVDSSNCSLSPGLEITVKVAVL